MRKFHLYNMFFVLMFLMCCKNKSVDCNNADIEIENRWYEYNGGLDNLKITDARDLTFICNRINQFSEGKEVRTSYNQGYLTIFLNGRKIDMIFTVKNGVVYNVGIGKYVYDEELTNYIMKRMMISSRCWSKNCN